MIFVDANVFLRYLTSATTSADFPRKAQARNLFNKLETGDVLATTSEVVLHEVCYILGSPKHYHHIAAQVAPELSAMIQWPGFVFPMTDKDVYVRAFELWEEHPRLVDHRGSFAFEFLSHRFDHNGRHAFVLEFGKFLD